MADDTDPGVCRFCGVTFRSWRGRRTHEAVLHRRARILAAMLADEDDEDGVPMIIFEPR